MQRTTATCFRRRSLLWSCIPSVRTHTNALYVPCRGFGNTGGGVKNFRLLKLSGFTSHGQTLFRAFSSISRGKSTNLLQGTTKSKLNFNHIRINSSNAVKKEAKLNGPRPSTSELKRLLMLAKPERLKLFGAVCLLFVSSGVSMTIPFAVGKIVDVIYGELTEEAGRIKEKLVSMYKILVTVFVIGAFANFGRVYLIQTSGNKIVRRLREQLFSSIIKQEIGFFDKNRTGELINRLSADTALVGQSVTTNISDGLRSLAQAICGVGMMVYVSPKLTGIALCIVPPVVLLSKYYGRYMKGITKNIQDTLATATQVAEERISNVRTVRSFAQEMKEMEEYGKRIDHVYEISKKEALVTGVFWGSTGFAGNMIILTVLYNGGIMVTTGEITVGNLSAFLLYAAYIGVSVGGLTSFYTEMMRGIGASTRLWYLTDRIPSIPVVGGSIPSNGIQGTIQFNNVAFSYPTRQNVNIFSDLSLTIPAGSVTAVVGSSGSGKSTIGSLLLRFYDPSSGNICLDGRSISDLDPTWLRSQIGTVSQEPTLFSTTVAENIAYGANEPSQVLQSQIEDAARKANALKFIQDFPDGFDTLVGERGLTLSGGQRQRVAIARAILKDPRILILDEATSALDAESEYLVQEALEHIMVDRTVLVIAHRLSTIKSADQIAVLDAGKVVEIGNYQELMKLSDGMFRKLVERQTITM